jgi:hypothetical protein
MNRSLVFSLCVGLAALASSSAAIADETPDAPVEPAPLTPAPMLTPAPIASPAPVAVPAPTPAVAPVLTVPGPTLVPALEIFTEYDLRVTRSGTSTDWFHNFDVPRAHGSLTGSYGPARARLVIEAVRSASEGALIGVAGDSLVLRLREASAGYRQGEWLAIDAGVVPTLTVPELDRTFNLRAVAATPLESTALAAPADLGATARATFPKGLGFAAIGAYNGEGYTGRELNRGKNLEFAAMIHPLPGSSGAPLGVFASYVLGSAGTGKARADRLTGAVVWQGVRVRAGAVLTYAWGVGESGEQRSLLFDGFVRAEPIDRLLFGLRAYSWMRDTAIPGDRIVGVTGAAGYRIADPLEAFLAVTRTLPGAAAEAALPGINRWDLRVIARVAF